MVPADVPIYVATETRRMPGGSCAPSFTIPTPPSGMAQYSAPLRDDPANTQLVTYLAREGRSLPTIHE
jgi:hypothetical protein